MANWLKQNDTRHSGWLSPRTGNKLFKLGTNCMRANHGKFTLVFPVINCTLEKHRNICTLICEKVTRTSNTFTIPAEHNMRSARIQICFKASSDNNTFLGRRYVYLLPLTIA